MRLSFDECPDERRRLLFFPITIASQNWPGLKMAASTVRGCAENSGAAGAGCDIVSV
jgi:hypothetical protein